MFQLLQKMSEPSVSMECAVCSDTPTGPHFGVSHICRACSAFFRRSVVENKTFKCLINNNCVIDKSQKCLCKKCRLKKCFDVGMLVAGVKGKRLKRQQEEIRIEEEIEKIEPKPLLLTKLRDNFKTLCEERKRTELALFSEEFKKSQAASPIPGYFRCTAESIRECNKVHLPAVVEFLSKSFEEYSQLTEDQKWLFIKPFHIYLQWFDACYLTYQYLPPELYSQYLITSSTSFWDPKVTFHTHFSLENAPDFMREKLAKYMPEFINKETSNDKAKLITEMNRLKVTEMEYAGLVGLLFWNSSLDHTLEILPLINRVRARILMDIGLYYKGLGLSSPEIRLGEVISLLPLIVIHTRRFRSSLQLFNVFNTMDKNDYFYQLIHNL